MKATEYFSMIITKAIDGLPNYEADENSVVIVSQKISRILWNSKIH